MEKVKVRDEKAVSERLKYCPECKEKNIFSSVKRLQYEKDRYWVFCTRKDRCSFLEEFRGKTLVTKDDLILYGLPGQLLDYMNIYHEDINKIVRFCMSEYIKVSYVALNKPDYDLVMLNNSVRNLAKSHGIDGPAAVTGVIKTNEEEENSTLVQPCTSVSPSAEKMKRFSVDPCLDSQNSQPSELFGKESTSEEDILLGLSGFSDLENISQISQITQVNKSLPTVDDNLTHLCKNVDESPKKLSEGEDHRMKDKPSLEKMKKIHNPYACMRKLARSLVADLPKEHRETIKTAFSRIKGYNFPYDFANNSTTDKIPLFQILKERKNEERIKAENDEQFDSFMSELNFV